MPVSEICSIFAQPITIMLQRINMKKLLIPFVLMTIVLLLDACSSAKQVAYFQNIDSTSLTASKGLYDARIMPKDLLTITVVTSDPSTSKPFNLSIQSTLGTDGRLGSTTGSLLQYLVNNDGDIDFPVVEQYMLQVLQKTSARTLSSRRLSPILPNQKTLL